MTQSVFTVRASSMGTLFDCAHRWEGVHILGMRSVSGLPAHLGKSIHASTAAFDAGKLPGAAPITADDAAGVFVDSLRDPESEVDLSDADMTMREAEKIGLLLTTRYCLDVSPQFNFSAVEMTLKPFDIDCGNGIVVRLTGQMDRARVATSANGGYVIPDVKTGRRVIVDGRASLKARAPQLGTYELLFEHTTSETTVGGQVIALQTSSKPQTAVSPVINAKRVMLGSEEAPGLLQHAAAMFQSGLFPPNTQSILCSRRYCARWDKCIFKEG